MTQSLFEPSYSGYDFLIRLDPTHITRLAEHLHAEDDTQIAGKWAKFVRNQKNAAIGGKLRVGFNPAELLVKEIEVRLRMLAGSKSRLTISLQKLYPNVLLPFYDVHGGLVIACLWHPLALPHRNFKPYLGFNTEPASSSGSDGKGSSLTQLNRAAVLKEVERLGAGLITRVEVLKAD